MCLFNANILKQTVSEIHLSWEHVSRSDVYKVISFIKDNSPAVVYWGCSTECTINHLSENVCYKFQIFSLTIEADKYRIEAASDIIRASTLPNIPSTVSILRAIRKSQEYLLKRYLKSKPLLKNVCSANGLTPLANAIVIGNLNAAEILLSSGANVELGCPIIGRTPLQMAFFYGDVKLAKLLLEYKADKSAKDCIGMNFAHYAVDGGHLNAIELALKKVPDLEDQDNCGWTILLRAVALHCSVDIVQLLLRYKCNPNALDKNNHNALDLATISNQLELMELFDQQKNEGNSSVGIWKQPYQE